MHPLCGGGWMINNPAKSLPRNQDSVSSRTPADRELMARALAIYSPDIGLAIHRALEARAVLTEDLGSPILDLGCYDGRFAHLWTRGLAKPPCILGCDLGPMDLKRAVTEGRLTFALAADGRQLPLKDGCIATVIANSVLTHVPELDNLIAETARVLRSEGQLLVSVPGPSFENQLAWVRFCKRLGLPWLARRIGDWYHLHWQQWHRDGEVVWSRRLAAHGLFLTEARPYPGNRTGVVWSLVFSLIRVGFGRFTLLHLLYKLWEQQWMAKPAKACTGILAPLLAPLLTQPGTREGSLFLIAHKRGPATRASITAHNVTPRVSAQTRHPSQKAAFDWLIRSNIRVQDEAPVMRGGYGTVLDGRTGKCPSLYCEITGYAAQFWLRQNHEETKTLALAAGDCLLRTQVSTKEEFLEGAFPYGLTRPDGSIIPAYFSFDAAVCAAALVDLAVQTEESRFAEGACRAGGFLTRMQTQDGSFLAMHTAQSDHPGLPPLENWFTDHCILHGKNAIALLKLWRLTNQLHWRDAALRVLDWVCKLQGVRGDFPQRAGAPYCMTHTHCYATEGLLYAGLVLGEERYLTAGIRGAEWLRVAQRRDGALYQDYQTDGVGFPRPAPWSPLHIGPIAQAARIWWVATFITADRPWVEAATRALAFLKRTQIATGGPQHYGAFPRSTRRLGPWFHYHPVYSPWEAMFACEAVRLWTTGMDELAWSIF
jgi:SAM-dependent methyltransferase